MPEKGILEFYDIESGENVRFEVVEQTTFNGETFLLVTLPEPAGDEENAFILRVKQDNGEDLTYETVDDETLLAALSDIFEELLEDTEIQG